MAFLPDEAVVAGRALSLAARVLYDVYCCYRNPQSGITSIADGSVIEQAGIGRSTFFQARRELSEKGWIQIESYGIRCIKGQFPSATPSELRNVEGAEIACDSPAMCIFKEFYPDILLSPQDQGKINETVKDMKQLRETLQFWKTKGHNPTSVVKWLDNYARLAAKKLVGAFQPRAKEAVAGGGGPVKIEANEIPRLIEYVDDLEAELRLEGREPQDWEAKLIAEARKYRKVA